MSTKLFQGIVHKMGESVNRTIGVIDDTGAIVACSDLSKIGEIHKRAVEELVYGAEMAVLDGYSFKPIGTRAKADLCAFAQGTDELAANTACILAVALENLKSCYDDKYDRTSFIKSIILDSIMPADIYAKAKELHFPDNQSLVAYLIRFSKKPDVIAVEVISSIFSDKAKDYVIGISDTDVALIRMLSNDSQESPEDVAKQIVDTVSSEFYVTASIGIGTVVPGIKELARSYKEAQVALEVGKVFDSEKNISNYSNLGIGRLIYHLPTTLCEMFLAEVMESGAIDSLDRETLLTIQSFFENSLNVSETSRKLFIHRNTLVYRLDKIKKITGLDLREFESAITFKVALMVRKYLASKANN